MRRVEASAQTEYVERVLRALRMSGRMLVKTGERWSVMTGGDRRRRVRLPLTHEEVEMLALDGVIIAVDADAYVPFGLSSEPLEHVEPSVFIAAGMRQHARRQGFGFAALALRARREEGALTMRHIQAGLQLIADAEQRHNADQATMNRDALRASQRRPDGRRGLASDAARRLRRVKVLTDPLHWSMAWMLCVEGASLRAARMRFGLRPRSACAAFTAALEAVASAYERQGA